MVVTDSRKKLTSEFIERIGIYNPLGETHLVVNGEAALRWIALGATMSATVRKLLKRAGVKLDGSLPVAAVS